MGTNSSPTVETTTVTLSQASKLLDRPENTIREWIKIGRLTGRRDSRGRWIIERSELMACAYERPQTVSRLGATSKATARIESATEASTERYIRSLEGGLDRERRINDDLRNQIKQLEGERSQHLAEMRALLTKDAKTTDGVLSRWLRR